MFHFLRPTWGTTLSFGLSALTLILMAAVASG